jgi:hypothetical protein
MSCPASATAIEDAGAAPAVSWASVLIGAARQGRLGWSLLWDLLVGYADSVEEPNIAAVLEHAEEPHLAAQPWMPADAAAEAFVQDAAVALARSGAIAGGGPGLAGEAVEQPLPAPAEDWFVLEGCGAESASGSG